MPRPRERRSFGQNLRSLFWWRRAADDVVEEMQLHADLRARELEEGGVPQAEARARAEREVGRPAEVVPMVARLAAATDRQSAVAQWLDEARVDARDAVRSCRRTPGLTVLTLLTIALGLGANAAIFGVVNVAVFAPLPFDRDNTLVRVREFRRLPDGTPRHGDASRRTADAIAQRPDLFTNSVPASGVGRTLARDTGAVRIDAARVGPGFTTVVGVTPILGRTFTEAEELAGDAALVALVSHGFWRRELGGGPDAIGQTIRLEGRAVAVVGVLPPGFHVPYDSDIWLPTRFGERERNIFLLARLGRGVSLEAAHAALEVIGRDLNAAYPDELAGLGVTAVRARAYFVEEEDRIAVAMMGAVALLLLIGGTNVAVLLTTKFASRSDEVAVRAALGCSRARQVRQFVTEGLLVFSAGGAAGLLLAAWLKDLLIVFLPDALATQTGLAGIPLDFTMVTFAAAVSVASGLGFGLIAARRVSHANLRATMQASGRAVAGSGVRTLLGRFVIAQVAIAIVLLSAAGTMVETFRRLQSRDLGFAPEGLLTLQFDFNTTRYGSADARRLLLDRVLERMRVLPGIVSASATTVNPVCCGNWGLRVTPEGHPLVRPELSPVVQHFIVAPGYFETMSQRVIEGRALTVADVAGAEMTVVVDRTAAARFWPGQSALGKRIKRGPLDSAEPWLTVVGIVENVIDEGDYPDAWYLPFSQHATGPSATRAHLMLRASGDPTALTPALRQAVAEIDPDLALYDIATMSSLVSDNLRQDRLGAIVASLFAAAGLLLACLGVYGVLAFAVNADRREIGVRLALGADRLDVLRVVLSRGLRWTAAGAVLGSLAAYGVCMALARFVENARLDVRLIVVAVAVLLGAALLAMLIPTRRALRVDPLRSLRME